MAELRRFVILGGAFVVSLALTRPSGAQAAQTQADDYTRYELLDAGSGRFRIWYEVTATTPGATHFDNPVRGGSVVSDERVLDAMTGKPLQFQTVKGLVARGDGVRGADTSAEFIRVTLARPVPVEGEGRIIIDKTYFDPKSYFQQDGLIVFSRLLDVKRNEVVLPPGYELVSCNFPAQVLEQSDGRVAVSFWNPAPADVALIVHARKLEAETAPRPTGAAFPQDRAARLHERAHVTEEAVFTLGDPVTHGYGLVQDFTESRPGVTSLAVPVAGPPAGKPRARNLDTGEELVPAAGAYYEFQGQRGQPPVAARYSLSYSFAAIDPGGSVRIRSYQTFADTAHYDLRGDELVFNVTSSAPTTTVILPNGWRLANSSIPGSTSLDPDGRVRIEFINGRPDTLALLITAHRR